MNQYKKLPACLSFLPSCLIIIFCFLFTGTSAEPLEIKLSRGVNDTIPSKRITENKIFGEDEVDVKASFKGGAGACRKYLERHINIPATAEVVAGPYKISVDFVVTKDGILKDFKPLTHGRHKLEDTLISVLKRSPEWIPASLKGRKVDSYTTVSFNYDIAEQ